MKQLRSLFIMTAVLTLSCVKICAEDNVGTLTVRGEASLMKPADMFSLKIGVETGGVTAEAALRDNNAKMRGVLESLTSFGFTKKEMQTGLFSIQPVYSQRPKSAPQDWKSEIVGYQVRNSLQINSDKIDQLGKLLDHVTTSGANKIDSIQFGLRNERLYRSEAITAATSNAMDDAKMLSQAAGVKLKRIADIRLDSPFTVQPVQRGLYMAKQYSAESVPIEAGDVEITTSVTIEYQLD